MLIKAEKTTFPDVTDVFLRRIIIVEALWCYRVVFDRRSSTMRIIR